MAFNMKNSTGFTGNNPIDQSPKLEEKVTSNEGAIAAVPLSFRFPDDYKFELSRVPEVQECCSSTTIHTSDVWTFTLPADCIMHISKMEEHMNALSKEEVVGTDIKPSLSLSERLEGWRLEKRGRNNNSRIDKFYHHEKSKRIFRSMTEVQMFIIYGLYPRAPQTRKRQKVEKNPLAIQRWVG